MRRLVAYHSKNCAVRFISLAMAGRAIVNAPTLILVVSVIPESVIIIILVCHVDNSLLGLSDSSGTNVPPSEALGAVTKAPIETTLSVFGGGKSSTSVVVTVIRPFFSSSRYPGGLGFVIFTARKRPKPRRKVKQDLKVADNKLWLKISW